MAVNSLTVSVSPDEVSQWFPNGNGTSRPVPAATPPYASVINVNPDATAFLQLNANAGVGNCTVNAIFAGPAGGVLMVLVSPDASGTRTITFGTHFRSTGTVAPAGGKERAVLFVSDGTDLVEVCRTSADV